MVYLVSLTGKVFIFQKDKFLTFKCYRFDHYFCHS